MPYKDPEKDRQSKREYYARNADRVKATSRTNTKRYRVRNREFVNSYKLKHGCLQCGFDKHPAALEFHHTNDDKEKSVARLCHNGASLDKIEIEMAKCILLCANCHRIEHLGK